MLRQSKWPSCHFHGTAILKAAVSSLCVVLLSSGAGFQVKRLMNWCRLRGQRSGWSSMQVAKGFVAYVYTAHAQRLLWKLCTSGTLNAWWQKILVIFANLSLSPFCVLNVCLAIWFVLTVRYSHLSWAVFQSNSNWWPRQVAQPDGPTKAVGRDQRAGWFLCSNRWAAAYENCAFAN